ncbi:TetR/AcrR family transcriptional regulator [Kibdelosporangium persicum]|uniref:DNA-binding transcriptional regulator, AcrR family n=1 Tax=Kibdelosporangium persicum TaxID=2698649 RepID=A0ABX2FHA3_9PSEU|nr:TetR/AcrR family transcriptional regulator [Kibdelosporangium persicum]NRN70781.1 DNA-binding transcriptional regulator, AcrR family [Kibdelosporangium persicum]
MPQTSFRRARRPEQKLERRTAILRAARELAVRSGVRNVSLGHIAAEVCLAKSNVVRYFGTREEIYLELTIQEMRDFAQDMHTRLAQASGLENVTDALTEALAQRELLCDLISECATSLERNVSLDVARAFKLASIRAAGEVGADIARADPRLTEAEGLELASAAVLLAGVLYPLATPPPVIEQLYAQDPAIAATRPHFVPSLKRALMAMGTGLPAVREPAPSSPS